MTIAKNPYQLSYWYLVSKQTPGGIEYFDEELDVILADENMMFEGRAYDIHLTRNINGTVSLEFKLPSKYIDPMTGALVDNYLTSRIINEGRIKLFYLDQWRTFIVKDIDLVRGKAENVYKCESLFITELSKNGYPLTFSFDLQNNVGNLDYLASKIFEDSSWTYVPKTIDLTEYKEEVLYDNAEILIPEGQISVTYDTIETPFQQSRQFSFTASDKVKVFYSDVINKSDYIQCIHIPSAESVELEKDNLIINKQCNFLVPKDKINVSLLNIFLSQYMGKKIVGSSITKSDSNLNTTVYKFIDSNNLSQEYWGYSTTTFIGHDNGKICIRGTTKVATSLYSDVNQTSIIKTLAITTTIYMIDNANAYYYYIYDGSTTGYVKKADITISDTWVVFDDTWTLLPSADYEYGIVPSVVWNYGTYQNGVFTEVTDQTIIGRLKLDNSSYQKVRSLEKEKTNRFDLAQDLCELFEVWLDTEIVYDTNGKISIDESTGKQIKRIFFRANNTQVNYAGFSYGLNLSDIKRTVETKNIVTKLYVESKDSDVAENGVCSIQTAKENLAGENFLINLDYYVNKGLLNSQEIYDDLYGEGDNLGYLLNLGIANKEYSEKMSSFLANETEIALVTERIANMDSIITVTSSKIATLTTQRSNTKVTEQKQLIDASISELQQEQDSAKLNKTKYQIQLDQLEATNTTLSTALTALTTTKTNLTKAFENKYSNFIQEGTWSGDNYIVADLYYIDAVKVCYENSRPKISYDIDVVDISIQEGYELYRYNIGDITYIEDEEYFGYNDDGTPYREQVVVSEIEEVLDNPSQNKITIQNYKTQFEDLFQRLSASTQTLELNKSIYSRAVNFTSGNEIDPSTIQKTLLNNNLILSESGDQTVVIDNTGVALRDALYPTKMMRIVAKGLLVSKDGGVSWDTGISADGINTNLLTAGRIDAGQINIINGDYKTFGWDRHGLSAYSHSVDNEGLLVSLNENKFVRMDQFGLYFVNNVTDFNSNLDAQIGPANKLNLIKTASSISLLWDGFTIKTNNGAVTITSANDIQVLDSNVVERLKIGQIATGVYGMYIKNASGVSTFTTGSDGKVAITNGSLTLNGANGYLIEINPTVGIKLSQNGTSKALIGIDGTVSVGGGMGGWSENGDKSALERTDSVNWARLGGVYAFSAGDSYSPAFKVGYDGSLIATSATVSGTITASSGSRIGAFNVNSSSISYGNFSINTSGRIYLASGLSIYPGSNGNFVINCSGNALDISAEGVNTNLIETDALQVYSSVNFSSSLPFEYRLPSHATSYGANVRQNTDSPYDWYRESSSREFKKNIADISPDIVADLYKFRITQWNTLADDIPETQYGLIAEEVFEINPHFCSFGFENNVLKFYEVHYLSFIPLLIKDAQLKEEKYTQLENRVKSLEDKYGTI